MDLAEMEDLAMAEIEEALVRYSARIGPTPSLGPRVFFAALGRTALVMMEAFRIAKVGGPEYAEAINSPEAQEMRVRLDEAHALHRLGESTRG